MQPQQSSGAPIVSRLRRDLGTIESYAALIGILIGAGIFKVTSDAGAITGPSVILSYIILMPAILAAVEAYATVSVKARVDGQIVEVGFKEGDEVSRGRVLCS